jgi:hypothetical protein
MIIVTIFFYPNNNEQVSAFNYISYNEFIKIEIEANKDYINELYTQLEKLPTHLLNDYIEGGNQIHIVNTPIVEFTTQLPNHKDISGMFNEYDGYLTIWLKNDRFAIEIATIHEFGHYIDYIENDLSTSDDFMRIYEAEKDSFGDNVMNPLHTTIKEHISSNTTEFFAEAFAYYIIHPEKMKTHCPMLYEYYEQLLS